MSLGLPSLEVSDDLQVRHDLRAEPQRLHPFQHVFAALTTPAVLVMGQRGRLAPRRRQEAIASHCSRATVQPEQPGEHWPAKCSNWIASGRNTTTQELRYPTDSDIRERLQKWLDKVEEIAREVPVESYAIALAIHSLLRFPAPSGRLTSWPLLVFFCQRSLDQPQCLQRKVG